MSVVPSSRPQHPVPPRPSTAAHAQGSSAPLPQHSRPPASPRSVPSSPPHSSSRHHHAHHPQSHSSPPYPTPVGIPSGPVGIDMPATSSSSLQSSRAATPTTSSNPPPRSAPAQRKPYSYPPPSTNSSSNSNSSSSSDREPPMSNRPHPQLAFFDDGWENRLSIDDLDWHRTNNRPQLTFALAGPNKELLHLDLRDYRMTRIRRNQIAQTYDMCRIAKLHSIRQTSFTLIFAAPGQPLSSVSSYKSSLAGSPASGYAEEEDLSAIFQSSLVSSSSGEKKKKGGDEPIEEVFYAETAEDCDELVYTLQQCSTVLEELGVTPQHRPKHFDISLPDWAVGCLCLHKGPMQKRGKIRQADRYAWLCRGRLLVFRAPGNAYPINSIRINEQTKINASSDTDFEVCANSRSFVFRVTSRVVRDVWLRAFEFERESMAYFRKHSPEYGISVYRQKRKSKSKNTISSQSGHMSLSSSSRTSTSPPTTREVFEGFEDIETRPPALSAASALAAPRKVPPLSNQSGRSRVTAASTSVRSASLSSERHYTTNEVFGDGYSSDDSSSLSDDRFSNNAAAHYNGNVAHTYAHAQGLPRSKSPSLSGSKRSSLGSVGGNSSGGTADRSVLGQLRNVRTQRAAAAAAAAAQQQDVSPNSAGLRPALTRFPSIDPPRRPISPHSQSAKSMSQITGGGSGGGTATPTSPYPTSASSATSPGTRGVITPHPPTHPPPASSPQQQQQQQQQQQYPLLSGHASGGYVSQMRDIRVSPPASNTSSSTSSYASGSRRPLIGGYRGPAQSNLVESTLADYNASSPPPGGDPQLYKRPSSLSQPPFSPVALPSEQYHRPASNSVASNVSSSSGSYGKSTSPVYPTTVAVGQMTMPMTRDRGQSTPVPPRSPPPPSAEKRAVSPGGGGGGGSGAGQKGKAKSPPSGSTVASVLDRTTGLHRELSLFNGFVSPGKINDVDGIMDKPNQSEDDLAIVKLKEQYEFFVFSKRYLRDFHITTRLPSLESWREKSFVQGLRRSVNTKNVDAALEQYHNELARINKIIATSRVVFKDTSANPTHSTIDFAYPPFASCRFVIGSWAAVEPALIFRRSPGYRQWSESVLSGALRSAAVAKELMQSCPDLEEMLMSSKEDNERAKRIMHEDQLSALHNLTIASYLLDAQSDKNKKMNPGDRIPWQRFLDAQTEKGNERYLKGDIVYLYSPSMKQVQSMNAERERLLCEPLRWLSIVRELQTARLQNIIKLHTHISEWSEIHAQKRKTSERTIHVEDLTAAVQEEVEILHRFLSRMPASRALNEVIRTHNRTLHLRRRSHENVKPVSPRVSHRPRDHRRQASMQHLSSLSASRSDLFASTTRK